MSLSVSGVWKVGVWAQTVWADGVWREGAYVPSVPVPVPEPASTGGGGGGTTEHWRTTWKRRKKFDDAIEATLLEAFAPVGKVDLVKEEVRWIKPDAGEFLKKLKGRPFVEEDEEEDLLLLM